MTAAAKDNVDKDKVPVKEEVSEEEWDKWVLKTMERLAQADHGRFILQGEVVDENGIRLDGVTLELEKDKLKNFGWESDSEEETLIINGTFQLDLKGYAMVRLYFSKDGYYNEKIDFSIQDISGEIRERKKEIEKNIYEGKEVSQKDIDQIVFKKDGIRIVLEKQGKLTSLTAYNRGPLEYTTTGKGIVINFDKHPASSLRVIDNIEDPKQLPENCVYMVADKDLDGKIATVQKKSYLADGTIGGEYEVPRRVKLIMTGPESGFIEYKLNPNKKPTRQMKEAPENGYEKEILIEGDDISKEDSEGVIFYFKTKDKYGKGSVSISKVSVSEDRSTLKVSANFKLQPDGSRNLETGDR